MIISHSCFCNTDAGFFLIWLAAPSTLRQVELETSRQQISLLNQQKELLRERLETMSDYSSVRKEKTELQGQLRLLGAQLEEAREENQILRAGEALTCFQTTSQEEV